jgi:uncharacterized protein
MKRIFLALAFLVLVFAQRLGAEEIPRPTGWVQDYAGVMPQEYRNRTTRLIEELERKTSAEIFVVTLPSIAPYDEKSYARMLFDSWHPGKKGKDNGVLVLLAMKERRWRIETGYGLEGILPDGLCGQIGRSYMVPYFKSGDYGKGLYYGVAAIAGIIAKNANAQLDSLSGVVLPRQSSSSSKEKDGRRSAALMLFFMSLVTPIAAGIIFVLIACFMAASLKQPLIALVMFAIYLAASSVRFLFWRNLPISKRKGGFFMYGGGYGYGGGFGGGGFGGGGGGCGGGGGAGGGF